MTIQGKSFTIDTAINSDEKRFVGFETHFVFFFLTISVFFLI